MVGFGEFILDVGVCLCNIGIDLVKWLVIFGVVIIFVFLYVMLGFICNIEVYGNNFKIVKYCFKFSYYGKLFLEESLLS